MSDNVKMEIAELLDPPSEGPILLSPEEAISSVIKSVSAKAGLSKCSIFKYFTEYNKALELKCLSSNHFRTNTIQMLVPSTGKVPSDIADSIFCSTTPKIERMSLLDLIPCVPLVLRYDPEVAYWGQRKSKLIEHVSYCPHNQPKTPSPEQTESTQRSGKVARGTDLSFSYGFLAYGSASCGWPHEQTTSQFSYDLSTGSTTSLSNLRQKKSRLLTGHKQEDMSSFSEDNAYMEPRDIGPSAKELLQLYRHHLVAYYPPVNYQIQKMKGLFSGETLQAWFRTQG
ncbi:unnamed protein product, partial [Protopolystoma xenopodis]